MTMKSPKIIPYLVACISLCLRTATGIATSHQSFVSGEGWGYSYDIVHGPHGIGHAVGESYPHGYGGFGTYAPSYGYGGYGLGHHGVPAVHAPLPAVPAIHQLHSAPEVIHFPEAVKVLAPIKTIHPLPHALPAEFVKPISAPEYILPAYQAGHHYGGEYGSGYDIAYGKGYGSGSGDDTGYGHHYGTVYPSDYHYGDILPQYEYGHDNHFYKDFQNYDDILLSSHGLYGGYLGDQYKSYKPYYHNYYGSSYHH